MAQGQSSPRGDEAGEEYQRIYGTAKGREMYGPGGVPNLGDDLSDWER